MDDGAIGGVADGLGIAPQRARRMQRGARLPLPAALKDLHGRRVVDQLTPATPSPLFPTPAIVPATCVPCEEVVGFHAASLVFTTPPMHEALLSRAI